MELAATYIFYTEAGVCVDSCGGMYFLGTVTLSSIAAEYYCAATCADLQDLYKGRNFEDVTFYQAWDETNNIFTCLRYTCGAGVVDNCKYCAGYPI